MVECTLARAVVVWALGLGLVLVTCGSTAFAQGPPPTGPAFEVVAIRPNLSGRPQMVIRTPASGLVTGTNVSAVMLLRYAYGLPEFRIVDVPDWAVRERFDVTARGPAEAPTELTRAMVRQLLADRFGAVVRTAQREMEIETLTRSGTELGPQVRPAGGPCDPGPDGVGACGVRPGYGRITAVASRLDALAQALSLLNRRHVIDATGLDGLYDFTLTYTPDDIALDPSTRSQFPSIDPDGPALATALREQLGLRLSRGRGPVEVLVVERLERPDTDGDAAR